MMQRITTIVVDRDAPEIVHAAARIAAERVRERTGRAPGVTDHAAGGAVRLVVAPGAGEDRYEIRRGDGGVTVRATSGTALMAGVGHLLRASGYADGTWTAPARDVAVAAGKRRRPIYFATHFGNWYCHAAEDEVVRYVEDLALDGYDTLVTWFDLHHYRDFDDGAAQWDRLARLDAIARAAGMGTARITIANESFEGQAPPGLGAVGRLAGTGYETDLCPSIPEARAIVLDNKRRFFERLRETTSVDWICIWPYDQGGCNCERCTPWSSTFVDLSREIAAIAREVLPDIGVALSAWWIGTHVAGEDEPFFEALARREPWFDRVVAGAAELRRWLADGRSVPDAYDVLSFPEISMFDALPWGGRGANPALRRFAREMRDLGEVIAGAVPYSEGRYEDINKFAWARMLWEPAIDPLEIAADYSRYHFGGDASSLILGAEEGLFELSGAEARDEEAQRLERTLPGWGARSWRWQVLRARLAIDALRARLASADGEPPAAVVDELREVYEHLQHQLYRHDERSLADWIYAPFERWLTMPLPAARKE